MVDYDSNHITTCCYIKHLNSRITSIDSELERRVEFSDHAGVNLFFNSGDVTLSMMLPVLVRRRMASRMALAVEDVTDELLEKLASLLGDEVYISGKDSPFHGTNKVITSLDIILSDRAADESMEKMRKVLKPFSSRVTVARRKHSFMAVTFTDQRFDPYPLMLMGSQPMMPVRGEHLGMLSSNPSAVLEVASYLHSMARVGRMKDFWEEKKEE